MAGSPRPQLVAALAPLYPGATLTPLAGDASTREFLRLTQVDESPTQVDERSMVVMDYGRPFSGETDDILINRIFREAGLRVASILRVLPDPGCLVLEDLGDRMLESELLASPSRQPELLGRAALLAAKIAERGTPVLEASARAGGPALDSERFRFEKDFFMQHYAGDHRGLSALPDALRDTLYRLADLAADSPRKVLCHRDFHSRNLMVTVDGNLAMVDIQDARWGPDAYDLASLLRDAYLDIDEELIPDLIAEFLGALAQPPDPLAFQERFEIVSAQRMIKALGSFGYQVAVRGQSRYLDAIPRTLARLDRLLPASEQLTELHRHLKQADLI